VKIGQQVQCTLESLPGQTLEAIIRSVGKTFEPDSKAIHLYVEIGGNQEHLIPGMYVKGRIITRDGSISAIPEEGLVREGDRYYIFTAGKEEVEGELMWAFKPVEVIKGIQDNGWAEVKLLRQFEGGTLIAMNNAYYLLAELKKGETEHQH
jgi:cobalt-zinc-cadmium efflux system membrane fusion protein